MTYVVEVAPTNGPDDADAAMNWVDITAYVNDRIQPVGVAYGRQTDLQAVQPGALTLTLNNADHRFTAGNPTSPYYPGWRAGMRIRARETIGGRSFVYLDGNMLQPDLTINNPDVDQQVAVTAVDRLGRLAAGRKFVSTLAEYIRYNAGGILSSYYPLGEPSTASIVQGISGGGFEPPLSVNTLAVTLGNGSPVTGDDLNVPTFVDLSPTTTIGNGAIDGAGSSQAGVNVLTFTNAQVVTFLAWVYPMVSTATESDIVQLNGSGSVNFGIDQAAGRWNLAPLFGGWGSLAGTDGLVVQWNQWQLVGFRLRLGGTCEIWINGIATTMAFGGAAPGSATFSEITFAPLGHFSGRLAHAQIYTSSGAGDYSMAAFTAQAAAGLTGLYGQFAGQRITTMARYAGMSPADLAIDTGTGVMQKAALAGKTPLQAMQEAADTDQGLLHAVGRKLVFHSRKRRYDL